MPSNQGQFCRLMLRSSLGLLISPTHPTLHLPLRPQIDRCFGFDTSVEEAQRSLISARVEARSSGGELWWAVAVAV